MNEVSLEKRLSQYSGNFDFNDRIQELRSRGLADENVIYDLIVDEVESNRRRPKILKAEMYDKMNYMCRCYMDVTPRIRLDYDFVPNISALKTAIICFLEKAPVFHSRFIDNHVVPYWRVCSYNIDEVLTVKDVENIEESADEFMTKNIDITGNVQIKFGVFISNGKCAICANWNHQCADGGDMKHILADIIMNYNAYSESATSPLAYHTGTRSYSVVYDGFSAGDKRKAKTLFANVSTHDKHTLPFTNAADGLKTHIVRCEIEDEILRSAKAVCKAVGATVNDALSAAYISAFYRYSGCTDGVGINCAVDLRRYIADIDKTGYTNHTTFMPCSVAGKHDSMKEMLIEVTGSTKKAKRDPFMRLHGLPLLNIGYNCMIYAQAELIIKAFYNNANLSVSNMGKLDADTLSLNGRRPNYALMAGAAKNKPCALMSAITLGDTMTTTICIKGNDEDKKIVADFLALFKEEFTRLSRGE